MTDTRRKSNDMDNDMENETMDAFNEDEEGTAQKGGLAQSEEETQEGAYEE